MTIIHHLVISHLSDELKNVAKTLKIDTLRYKIVNGSRNNTLLSFADSLLRHHNIDDIENLRFFFKVNQKLCEQPLDEKELESIWTQATRFIKNKTIEKEQSFDNKSKTKKGYNQSNDDAKNKRTYRFQIHFK